MRVSQYVGRSYHVMNDLQLLPRESMTYEKIILVLEKDYSQNGKTRPQQKPGFLVPYFYCTGIVEILGHMNPGAKGSI